MYNHDCHSTSIYYMGYMIYLWDTMMVICKTLYIYNYDGYMMVCYTNHLCTNSDSATIMIYNMRLNCHIISVRNNIPTNISILCRHKSMVVLQIIISIIKRKQHYLIQLDRGKKNMPPLRTWIFRRGTHLFAGSHIFPIFPDCLLLQSGPPVVIVGLLSHEYYKDLTPVPSR